MPKRCQNLDVKRTGPIVAWFAVVVLAASSAEAGVGAGLRAALALFVVEVGPQSMSALHVSA